MARNQGISIEITLKNGVYLQLESPEKLDLTEWTKLGNIINDLERKGDN